MGVIAEFTVDDPDLLLKEALAAVPEMTVTVEQDTASRDGLPIFYFWASGGDFAAFEAALDRDGDVAEYEVLETIEDRRMYRVGFSRASFYDAYRESTATFLSLTGSDRGWRLQMRFPDRESLRRYRQSYEEEGVSFVVHRLYTDTGGPGDEYGLTDKQRRALALAHREGYFSQPREVTLEDLAADLDISPQAVSARLQRGMDALLAATIDDEDLKD